jgi:hypothetical protein
MRPFTDEEFKELPHVLWTSEDNWDPTSLDSVISDDPNWYEAEPSPPLPDPMYDEYGEFRGRVLINQHEWQVHYFDALNTKTCPDNDDKFHDALEQFADNPDSVIDLVFYRANRAHYVCDHETVEVAPKFVMTLEPNYGQLCPHLGWLPVDTIKKTFEHTTQLTRMPMSTILKKRYKSPNPALNVCPRDKPVATNTIYSDTPVIDCDKICMMTTRLACNRAIESLYWRMDNDLDVGLLTGYVLYRLPVELEFMDLDTFPR